MGWMAGLKPKAIVLSCRLCYNIHSKFGGVFLGLNEKISALKEHVLSDSTLLEEISHGMAQSGREDSFVVFISICDGKSRALVFHDSGASVSDAWNKAYSRVAAKIKEFAVQKKKYNTVWVKVDVVDSVQEINVLDINKRMREVYFANFYRNGLAFDSDFKTAFLEAEVNGNKMLQYYSEGEVRRNDIGYQSNRVSLENVNAYLQRYYKRAPIRQIPERLFEFTARSFFCDENNTIYDLYSSGQDTGRRVIHETTGEVIRETITKASRYLESIMLPDGRFVYGYFPMFGNNIDTYNIVRHASTLWSLVNLYRMTGDDRVLPKLDAAVDYMITQIEYSDKDTAYLVEHNVNEVKLGAQGVAIIMLTEYMSVLETDKYAELVRCLANGVIKMQNPDGTFIHVLEYPSYEMKETFRIIYYDGEAVFGLTRAYSLLKDEKYLQAAKAGVENFIEKNYVIHRDHWVAYSMNEITQYLPDPRYFEFAMRNVWENLEEIYNRGTSYHTYLELLMISWQTLERLLESGQEIPYMSQFSIERFAQTIYRRARHMLNGFFYPEYAMYMKQPQQILDSFMVRHHNYRTRIDDVQHFIGGYYFYTIYYDRIRAHLSEEFLAEIDSI